MESEDLSHLHNNFLATAVMNKYRQMSQFSKILPRIRASENGGKDVAIKYLKFPESGYVLCGFRPDHLIFVIVASN